MHTTDAAAAAGFDPAAWYTTNASSYAAVWDGVISPELAVFAVGCRPGGVVVDPACGTGRDVAAWRACGFSAFGSDIAAGQVATAARACGSGIVQASFFELPYATGSVDVVWASAAIVHLSPADAVRALSEFARVSRIGGRLFVNAKTADGSVDPGTGVDAAGRWFHLWTVDELVTVAAQAGWSPITFGETSDGVRPSVRWAQVIADVPF